MFVWTCVYMCAQGRALMPIHAHRHPYRVAPRSVEQVTHHAVDAWHMTPPTSPAHVEMTPPASPEASQNGQSQKEPKTGFFSAFRFRKPAARQGPK